LTKILIPRSDSVSAKIVEPSDFTEYFSFMDDYIINGFTVTAGSGLAVSITSGKARLKGLFVHNTATETVSSLTASTTNYVWITLARDGNGEAESWNFTKGTSATVPTDSVLVAKVTTSGSAVTAVDENDTPKDAGLNNTKAWGGGGDGNITISSNTTLSDVKYYDNLVINSGVTVTKASSPLVIYAKGTITVNGTIDMTGKGGAGTGYATSGSSSGAAGGTSLNMQQGAGATGGAGSAGSSGGSYPGGSDNPAQNGSAGGAGGAGGANSSSVSPNTKHVTKFTMNETNFVGAGGGGGGAGGNGGNSSFPNGVSPCSGAQNGINNGVGYGRGGKGGAGGGMIVLIGNSIVIGSGGSIKCNGENGTVGTGGILSENYNANSCDFGGDSGNGGGGAGGNGGYIYLVYNALTNNGSSNIQVNAGTGAAAGTGGNGTASAGGNGTVGLILHDD